MGIQVDTIQYWWLVDEFRDYHPSIHIHEGNPHIHGLVIHIHPLYFRSSLRSKSGNPFLTSQCWARRRWEKSCWPPGCRGGSLGFLGLWTGTPSVCLSIYPILSYLSYLILSYIILSYLYVCLSIFFCICVECIYIYIGIYSMAEFYQPFLRRHRIFFP
jgi:hypothetical protein